MPAENDTQTADASSTNQAAPGGQGGTATADPKAAEAAKVDATGAATGGQEGKAEQKAGDAKAAEVAKPVEKQPRISEKLNEIRSREAKLEQREAEWKGQATKYEAELNDLRGKVAQIEAIKGDPLALLKLAGYEGDDAAERFAKDLTADPESRKVGRKISDLEKKLADKDAAEAKAREQAQYQQQLARAQANIKGELEKMGESAEFARAHGEEAVWGVIEVCDAYFSKHGKALPLTEAIKAVDRHYEAELQKGLSTSRGKKLATPAPIAPDPKATAKETEKPVAGSRTLGNSTAASNPAATRETKTRIGRRSEREEIMDDLRATFSRESK